MKTLPTRHAVSRRLRHGFTLVELLTVVAIIGVLFAILVPVLGRMRESARGSRCVTNLRQVAVAIQSYAGEHHGSLPPTGFFGISPYYNRDARNFQNSLLPYLDLKPATSWSTKVATSAYSPTFDCQSYKGDVGGKGYSLHDRDTKNDPALDIDGNKVRPWGCIQDAAGTKINPAPQKLLNMPADEWALRDADSATEGSSHPGYKTTLYFDWHVDHVAVNN